MADINEILGKQINSVKELKKAISDLQNSLIGVDTESEEFKTTSQQLAAAQEELVKVTRAGKEENIAAKDSIVGLKNEYKALYDQYKMLTEEQRNSDFGKQMAESLNTLSTKINDTQKGVGAFKDNIGRYTEGVTDAFNQMGMSLGGLQKPMDLATKGTKTFGTALKGLAANPIVLVITALVAILVKVADSIKKNEELTNRLKEAMAVFRPILDGIANVFDFLAGLLVKTVEGLTKVAEKILSIIPGMKQAIQSHKDLAKATNDLTKAQRENSVLASQKNAEIERLREEASATDDVIEKKKLLEQAKALQAEVDQREIELAQEELRILEEYGEKTANSAEENEKLAAAQKKVNDAIAQGERNMRQYNKQLDAATRGTKSATSSGKNYREEAKKLYEQTIENSKTELQKLTEKYEKEKKLLEKYHYDTKLLTKKYNEDVAKLQAEEYKKTREKYLSQIAQHQKDNERFLTLMAEDDQKNAIGFQLEGLEQDLLPRLKTAKENVMRYIKEGFIGDEEFFADLGEGFKKLKEEIEELNSKYGLNIVSFTGLDAAIAETENQVKVLLGEWRKAVIEEKKKLAEEGNLNLELQDLVPRLGQGLDSDFFKSIADEIRGVWNTVFNGETDEYSILVAENTRDALEKEKEELEKGLLNFEGTQDQKVELLKRYYEVVQEIYDKEVELTTLQQERTAQMVESMIDLTDRLSSAMNSYRSTMESVIDSEVKAGQISEKEAKEKKERLLNLEKWEQRFAIATIAADAAAGIFSVWKGYAQEKGTINPQTAAAAGPGAAVALTALNTKSLISAIAQTASLATTAAAQIAAARGKYVTDSNNFHADAGGGTSVASVPTLISSEPYTYTQTIQNADTEDELNKYNLWVSISDIESGLNHKVQVTDETSW